MINPITILALLVLSELPVEAVSLDGRHVTGELQSLSPQEIVVRVDGEPREISLSELQEVRPQPGDDAPKRYAAARPEMTVTLRDGSQLFPREFASSQRDVTLSTAQFGELQMPKSSVAHVRLSKPDGKLNATWQGLLEQDRRDDVVVVRKGDALDHVEGVVGAVDAKSVSLLLDGRSIPIPRSRVFGVIYAGAESAPAKPLCRFDLHDGQQLAAAAVQFDGESFQVKMMSGAEVSLAAKDVQRIDFSLGKIRSLAEVEPTSVEYPVDHPLYLPDVWKYRRGRNSRGEPLLLGGRTYEDGLWIHSGTTLRYRLGREYRRLSGLIGIDEDIGDCAPEVGIIFRGDGRVLLESRFTREDKPSVLDLDVEGVRDLEIEVTSNDPDGICEHLDLIEARLIK